MDMFEAYRTCIKKYATFSGRARRSEYWFFTLCNVLISLVFSGLLYFAQSQDSEAFMMGVNIVSTAYSIFALLPGLAVVVRRLHDTGHSGWYYFISLIPIAGLVMLLIALCKDSTPGVNEYGPNPKESMDPVSGEMTPTWVSEDLPGNSEYNNLTIREDRADVTVRNSEDVYETVSLKPVLEVKCTKGPITGKTAAGEVVYIGRDPKLCQLVFPGGTPGVSNVHCMLHTDGKSIEVCDLGSSYGTFLSDGTRLQPNKTVFITDGNTTQANRPSTNTIFIGSENVSIAVKLSSRYPM